MQYIDADTRQCFHKKQRLHAGKHSFKWGLYIPSAAKVVVGTAMLAYCSEPSRRAIAAELVAKYAGNSFACNAQCDLQTSRCRHAVGSMHVLDLRWQ